MKSKPIVLTSGIVDIHPNMMVDTLNGKPIHEGVCFMQIHCGEGTVKHKGKVVKFNIGAGLDGTTILMVNSRYAKVNLERMVEAAIAAGWLEDKLDFKT